MLLSFYSDLALDAIGAVCHKLSFLITYLDFIPLHSLKDQTISLPEPQNYLLHEISEQSHAELHLEQAQASG